MKTQTLPADTEITLNLLDQSPHAERQEVFRARRKCLTITVRRNGEGYWLHCAATQGSKSPVTLRAMPCKSVEAVRKSVASIFRKEIYSCQKLSAFGSDGEWLNKLREFLKTRQPIPCKAKDALKRFYEAHPDAPEGFDVQWVDAQESWQET